VQNVSDKKRVDHRKVDLGSLLVCRARSDSGGGDWPNYGGDKGGIRYSRLDPIKAHYQPEVLM
jgi:glucose dehydrogenase